MHRHDDGHADGVQKGAGMVFVWRDPAEKEILVLDMRKIRIGI